jgi:Na+/H+-dicarboxylate symporter
VFAGGEGLRRFASAIMPAQTIATSTQSSLASLSAMIECGVASGGRALAWKSGGIELDA